MHTFEDYDELAAALAEEDAIKVATWWGTAEPVWRASVRRGRPVFFVQDIETSYYAGPQRAPGARAQRGPGRLPRGVPLHDDLRRAACRSWPSSACRPSWCRRASTWTPSGSSASPRREDMLLALGRSNPLKNFPLTVAAWERLGSRPELKLFGVEPELTPEGELRLRRAAQRRGRERAAQPGHGVRADLGPRGLLPAAAGGHGRRARRWCAPTPTATATSACTSRTA